MHNKLLAALLQNTLFNVAAKILMTGVRLISYIR
jgi:hypothetical protein